MAIELVEAANSPRINSFSVSGTSRTPRQVERVYLLTGAASLSEASDAVASSDNIPSTTLSLTISDIRVELFLESRSLTYQVTAVYGSTGGNPASGGGGSGSASFSVSGVPVNVKKCLAVVNSGFLTSGAAGITSSPNFEFINVETDGKKTEIRGEEISEPIIYRSTQKIIPATGINAFEASCFALYNCTNSAAWNGYPAECVRFEGMTGSQSGNFYNCQLQFAIRPAKAAQPLNGMNIPAYAGWQRLEVRYKSVPIAGVGMVAMANAWAIQRMFSPGDFTPLGA